MSHNAYNETKFTELILYFCARSEGDPYFGATKLNKLLFETDFASFAQRGHSVTGAKYQRLPYGPAPVRIMPVKNALIEANAAVERGEMAGMFQQKRLFALRGPNLALFSGEDMAIADSVLAELLPLNASQVSERTHRLWGWRLTEDREPIEYFTACIPEIPLPLSSAEMAYGKVLAARIDRRASQ